MFPLPCPPKGRSDREVTFKAPPLFEAGRERVRSIAYWRPGLFGAAQKITSSDGERSEVGRGETHLGASCSDSLT